VIARVEPRSEPRSGERINLRVRAGSILLFDPVSGARIGAEITAPAAVS